jgi:hypothetical protein
LSGRNIERVADANKTQAADPDNDGR